MTLVFYRPAIITPILIKDAEKGRGLFRIRSFVCGKGLVPFPHPPHSLFACVSPPLERHAVLAFFMRQLPQIFWRFRERPGLIVPDAYTTQVM